MLPVEDTRRLIRPSKGWEQDVLLNPSKEGYTLLMGNPDWRVSVPARFWSYREVPDSMVPEYTDKGVWARCPFEVAKPMRLINGNLYQVIYTEEGQKNATLLLSESANADSP
jgi:hypothetical protein